MKVGYKSLFLKPDKFGTQHTYSGLYIPVATRNHGDHDDDVVLTLDNQYPMCACVAQYGAGLESLTMLLVYQLSSRYSPDEIKIHLVNDKNIWPDEKKELLARIPHLTFDEISPDDKGVHVCIVPYVSHDKEEKSTIVKKAIDWVNSGRDRFLIVTDQGSSDTSVIPAEISRIIMLRARRNVAKELIGTDAPYFAPLISGCLWYCPDRREKDGKNIQSGITPYVDFAWLCDDEALQSNIEKGRVTSNTTTLASYWASKQNG